jgi:DNA-binding response OmpR family regulator
LKIKKPGLPIIIITAKADEDSLVQGLAIADDYVRKPFGKRELLARIQKTLNEKISRTKVLEFGSLKLFPDTGLAEVSGTALNLRPREFSILSLLIINGEDTVDRERILRVVDRDADMYERSLDSHLSRIRKALQRAGVKDVEVLTVHGSGYRLKKAA